MIHFYLEAMLQSCHLFCNHCDFSTSPFAWEFSRIQLKFKTGIDACGRSQTKLLWQHGLVSLCSWVNRLYNPHPGHLSRWCEAEWWAIYSAVTQGYFDWKIFYLSLVLPQRFFSLNLLGNYLLILVNFYLLHVKNSSVEWASLYNILTRNVSFFSSVQ